MFEIIIYMVISAIIVFGFGYLCGIIDSTEGFNEKEANEITYHMCDVKLRKYIGNKT